MKLTTASQRILALLILLSAAICSFAYDIQDGRLYYNLNTAKQEATVTYGPTKPTGKITIPSSVTYNGTRYYVTAIGDEAFKSCTELTRVDGLDQVKSIGSNAFDGCYNITSIHLSTRLTSIGSCAFEGCKSITEITIPDNVKEIHDDAFFACYSLSSVKLGKGITSIGNHVFASCSNLVQIIIPNSVVSIGNQVFRDCDRLQTVCLPNNLPGIKTRTILRCKDLRTITIPNSVTWIEEYPFDDCSSLNSIYCLATIPPSILGRLFDSEDLIDKTLYVPAGTVDAYNNAYRWKDFPRIEEIDPDNIMDPGCFRALYCSGSGSGVKGDVNGDNQVNISDVSALVNILLKK